MIHVGNAIKKRDPQKSSAYYLKRFSFPDLIEKDYSKHDIVNADSQMQSLIKYGVKISYGHYSKRKSLISLIKSGFKLRKIIVTKNIDLVHVLWGSSTALMTTIFSSVPVVISFSGSDLLGTVNAAGKLTFGGKINKLFSQIAGLQASFIITKSEQMKNILWKFSKKKAVVIPNGVDLSTFSSIEKNEARRKIGWGKDEKIILFFDGNGAEVKDPQLANEVFAIVKEKLSSVHMKIINNVAHEQLKYYYNGADIMLLTSFHEGSNNSIKEAMSCQLPVVSVNVGDAYDRLNGVTNSSVVDTRDPVLIAESVIDILKKCNRSNGREFVSSLSLKQCGIKIVEIYKSQIV